jgi:hypothetical protein
MGAEKKDEPSAGVAIVRERTLSSQFGLPNGRMSRSTQSFMSRSFKPVLIWFLVQIWLAIASHLSLRQRERNGWKPFLREQDRKDEHDHETEESTRVQFQVFARARQSRGTSARRGVCRRYVPTAYTRTRCREQANGILPSFAHTHAAISGSLSQSQLSSHLGTLTGSVCISLSGFV